MQETSKRRVTGLPRVPQALQGGPDVTESHLQRDSKVRPGMRTRGNHPNWRHRAAVGGGWLGRQGRRTCPHAGVGAGRHTASAEANGRTAGMQGAVAAHPSVVEHGCKPGAQPPRGHTWAAVAEGALSCFLCCLNDLRWVSGQDCFLKSR